MKKLLIVGAGGHGRCCLDIAKESYEDISFVDDHIEGMICHHPVVGKLENIKEQYQEYQDIFIAIGDNHLRKQISEQAEKIGYSVVTLISIRASVSNYAEVGSGSVIFPEAVIESGAKITKGSIIAAGSIVNHDVEIKDFCLINTGSIIRPNSIVGECSRIDSRCLIKAGTEIPENAHIKDGEVYP